LTNEISVHSILTLLIAQEYFIAQKYYESFNTLECESDDLQIENCKFLNANLRTGPE